VVECLPGTVSAEGSCSSHGPYPVDVRWVLFPVASRVVPVLVSE